MERLERYSPESILARKIERLETATDELESSMKALIDKRKHRLEVILARMHGLSPTAKLVGGFGYISGEEGPVTSVDMVAPDQDIFIRLHDGEIRSKVVDIRKETIGGEDG